MAHTRHEVLLTFAIDGDLRFISHRDTVRMLTRALVRSGLPIAYSQGFNPHIKMALLLPRPVGLATDGDLAVVHLREPRDPNLIASQLRAELPEGACILGVQPLEDGRRPELASVTYELELGAEAGVPLPSIIRNFLDSNSVVIQRQDRLGQEKPPLDVRPLVQEIGFENVSVRHHHPDVGREALELLDEIRIAGAGRLEHRQLFFQCDDLDRRRDQLGTLPAVRFVGLGDHGDHVEPFAQERPQRRYGKVGGSEEDDLHEPDALSGDTSLR